MYRPLQWLSRRGGVCLRGVCLMGRGVCLEGDVCLGGVCLRGVSAWGCLPKGSVFQWVYTFPPVDRMTDTCENITFPSGGFMGAPLACAPPTAQNFLNFMQFFVKFGKIICWRPPGGFGPPPTGNPGSAPVYGTTVADGYNIAVYEEQVTRTKNTPDCTLKYEKYTRIYERKHNTYWTGSYSLFSLIEETSTVCSGRSNGGTGLRPPPGQNSFNFMQFLGNFGKILCWRPPPRGVGAPLLGEILDPPLVCNCTSFPPTP